jgi:hypothetical protein
LFSFMDFVESSALQPAASRWGQENNAMARLLQRTLSGNVVHGAGRAAAPFNLRARKSPACGAFSDRS